MPPITVMELDDSICATFKPVDGRAAAVGCGTLWSKFWNLMMSREANTLSMAVRSADVLTLLGKRSASLSEVLAAFVLGWSTISCACMTIKPRQARNRWR